jgi:hypothetical protein
MGVEAKAFGQTEPSTPLSLSIRGTCLLLLRHALIGHESLVWSKQ